MGEQGGGGRANIPILIVMLTWVSLNRKGQETKGFFFSGKHQKGKPNFIGFLDKIQFLIEKTYGTIFRILQSGWHLKAEKCRKIAKDKVCETLKL